MIADSKPIYLHCVIDTHNSYAFCALAATHQVEDAITLLDKVVLPFYKEHGLPIKKIQMEPVTDFRAGGWCKPDVYTDYLTQHKLVHEFPQRWPVHGFVERFLRTIKDEFFLRPQNTNRARPLKQLQTALNKWLHTYNHRRAHPGYAMMDNHRRSFSVLIYNVYGRLVSKFPGVLAKFRSCQCIY